MMWNYGFGWGFPFMSIFWIIFWVAIIFLIFGRHKKSRHWYNDDQSAEDILKERFAKGEIDEKEYKERLKVLRDHEK